MPSNKRLIPRDKEFIEDKKVCDLTYSKLQIESNWKQGEKHRYIYKEKINLSEWGRTLGVSRQTLKKRILYLKEAGLIKDKGEFYMIENVAEYAIYIPEKTLRILTNSMKKDTVKVYAYLGGWYKHKRRKGEGFYNFTRTSLLEDLGYKVGDTTLDKINDILLVLNKLDLIKTEERESIRGGIKTSEIIITNWKESL